MYGYAPCGYGYGGGIIALVLVIFIVLCLFCVSGQGHGCCGTRFGACC